MKISIIHPSRGRPGQAYETYRNWIADGKCRNPLNVNYYLSVDSDQIDEYKEAFKRSIIFVSIVVNDNHFAIDAINNAAKIASGDLLIVISDDTDCFEHWDMLLFEQLAGHTDFCAKTDDGLQPTLITMPIMDRVYYERYGYVYNPQYQHMFVDQELTAVAMMTGKYIKLPLLFPHNHYSTGRTKKDAVNVKNDATWQQGERLFNERLKSNFGIENPVIKYEDIVWR